MIPIITNVDIKPKSIKSVSDMSHTITHADGGAGNFGSNMYNDVANYIANQGGYDQGFSDKVNAIFAAAEAAGQDEELDWLIKTAEDLTGGYANNWKGDAANGEGHGSAQYGELYNLMDGMQNGGNWDALGGSMLNGVSWELD